MAERVLGIDLASHDDAWPYGGVAHEVADNSQRSEDASSRSRDTAGIGDSSGPARTSEAVFWLAVTASGAIVMVIEILGSRMLGPVFGVGLFVWSCLISVTLGALAVGYIVGGSRVDRTPDRRLLYRVLAIAGVFCALLVPLTPPVLLATMPLGLRFGPLVAACVLLGPPLSTLGMVSTIAIRLRSSHVAHAGRTAGRIYAASTFAGVVAALLSGFYLVPSFGVNQILIGCAVVLLAIAAIGLRVNGSSAAVLPLPALAIAGAIGTTPDPGEHISILESTPSAYGKLQVIEDTSHGSPLRLLRANHSFTGALWVESAEPAFSFVHLMEAVHLARPTAERALLLGLGIGSLSESLKHRGVRSDVVEIDPEVVRLAAQHFDFVPSGEVIVADARTHVQQTLHTYDIVVQDAFTGGDNPEHLLTREMFQAIRRVLTPDGIVAINIVGADDGPTSALPRAVARTLRSVFQHVRAFRDGPRNDAVPLHNLVYFAADSPITFSESTPNSFESRSCEQVLRGFHDWEVFTTSEPITSVITDARNPLGRMALAPSERFHELMNQTYPPRFWVN